MGRMTTENELSEMALEELDAACSLHFAEMKKITPWGGGIVIEVEVRDPALQTGAEARAVIGPPQA